MTRMCCCEIAGLSPTDVLKQEHRVIERVLDAMAIMLDRSRIDQAFFEMALDFLRNFADGCHHAKEEHELFPILESAGVPKEDGPIGCMLDEHEAGRAFIRELAASLPAAASGNSKAISAVRDAGAGYIELLRQHILKEDNVLFVMAERLLGAAEQKLMLGAFHQAEHSNGNAGKHERYLEIAEELCRRAQPMVAVGA